MGTGHVRKEAGFIAWSVAIFPAKEFYIKHEQDNGQAREQQ